MQSSLASGRDVISSSVIYYLAIVHFRFSETLNFKTRLSVLSLACENEILLNCLRIKNNYRINDVVLSLALKQRLVANGPLASKFNCGIACLRCFSATGKSGGKQPLSLGNGCTTKGVVIHELLHALGMMHEHCRADRDQFIKINFKNVRPSKWNELLNRFYVKF